MKASSGNSLLLAAAPEQRVVAALEAPLSAKAEMKRAYRKPALQRLGLLRSVTGSDLKW